MNAPSIERTRLGGASRRGALRSSSRRSRRVERVGVVLRVVADLDAVAERDRAGVVRQLAGDHAQQRGLAGAVDADDADLLAAPDREVDAAERRTLRRRTPSSGPRCGRTSATARSVGREAEPHRRRASRSVSTYSIFSSALTRHCTARALLACARKRLMKRSSRSRSRARFFGLPLRGCVSSSARCAQVLARSCRRSCARPRARA